MSSDFHNMVIGKKVRHQEFGDGVITAIPSQSFVTVFFQSHGEKQVPQSTLSDSLSWTEIISRNMHPATKENLERLWLSIEATELPLMESAATLTSAKVDLLPHQVTLVHRIANTQPRRFLIADEVGLGKTIETALIIRELASRGNLKRALIIVPAGLVENWRHELNDVFNLDFEVFGSEGDISDRKSNIFVKHNFIIASVDTLKQPARIKRLMEAPIWDLIVFDEAHHLSAYKTGSKSKKTQNFKLAESLKDRCRDIILLSATPHQGDHYRFWMLIRLLEPSLFEDEKDMVNNRYRLNAVVIRRTKADACATDGGTLFTRRVVNTEGFTLSADEMAFYQELLTYLRDGYDIASKQGSKGRALGFVMTIFQKIAASSFAAVRYTLQKRLLMLTIQESIERDDMLDVNGRERTLQEAKSIIKNIYHLPDDAIGNAQIEQLTAELKIQYLKKKNTVLEFVNSFEQSGDYELSAGSNEESVATLVSVSIPEERERIKQLLSKFPCGPEKKILVLIDALKQLWQVNPHEKVVIFATYLGSVDVLKKSINESFPDKGVEVIKGGDHGAKTAAQKRFRQPDGPAVLLATAAGREGINLQFAKILFNFDLPWNPMDLEQRIGRIHRYGQKHTAQIFNLVATDTIEGNIFLLLEQKLKNIAATLGKIDEKGQVTEDFRAQILGQISTSLNYDNLYQEALSDPTLRRTIQEIDVAMENANLARQVVFELFQDLEKFNLGDYQQYDDKGRGMQRLVTFIKKAVKSSGDEYKDITDKIIGLQKLNQETIVFTTSRETAIQKDDLNLFGLEHPYIKNLLTKFSNLPPEERGLVGRINLNGSDPGLLTFWLVTVHDSNGNSVNKIMRIGLSLEGNRAIPLEQTCTNILDIQPCISCPIPDSNMVIKLLNNGTTILHRELNHLGLLNEDSSYSLKLIACISII